MLVCVVRQRMHHAVCLASVQRLGSRFLKGALRTFSDAPATAKHSKKPLKRWELSVNPFTKIKCNLGCNISVKSLDPHAYPEADRAFVTLHVTDVSPAVKEDSFHLHYDERSTELQIFSDELQSSVTVELTAPIKCDLHIHARNEGNVEIQKMESDLCHVHIERGQCILSSVKGHEIKVRSSGGSVTGLHTIHGNVDISTAVGGNVHFKKIQGTTMNLSSELGDVKVKAIYAESTSVSTSSGKIQIGHIHGEAFVQSEAGDVVIDSSSGVLKVSTATGNIDAYVGQDGSADLHSQQGAVSVRVPSAIKTAVQLSGTSVSISSEIACQEIVQTSTDGKTTISACLNGVTDEERCIKASAENGAVELKTQSWFETLRIGALS